MKELSINKIFDKNLKNYNSIILELFHPLFGNNHAGNDGHFRFIGKYSEDEKGKLHGSLNANIKILFSFRKV